MAPEGEQWEGTESPEGEQWEGTESPVIFNNGSRQDWWVILEIAWQDA